MFTGLVESIGVIAGRSVRGGAGKLKIKPSTRLAGLRSGDSIAINGTCLTLEKEGSDGVLTFHAMAETFKRSNLGSLKLGGKVNLERALSLGDRLGGHLVQGHVDCVAKLLSLGKKGADTEIKVEVPAALSPFLMEKGSIAIDGVSLTIVSLADDFFTARLIPTTWNATALRFRKPGELLNLESDILGKYVARQLRLMLPHGPASEPEPKPWNGISMDDLLNAGF